MKIDPVLSHLVLSAFPVLNETRFVRHFASPIPFAPDTVFAVYEMKTGQVLTLVRTDYPDPYWQSQELEELSLRCKFINLLKPFQNDKTIEILSHDDMSTDFVVNEERTYLRY